MRNLFLNLVIVLILSPTFNYAQSKYPKYIVYGGMGTNFPVGDFASPRGNTTINGYAIRDFAAQVGVRRNLEKFSMGIEYDYAYNRRKNPFMKQTLDKIKPGIAWREPPIKPAYGSQSQRQPQDSTGIVHHHSIVAMTFYGTKPDANGRHKLELGLGAGIMVEVLDPINKIANEPGSDINYHLEQNKYQFTGLTFKAALNWNIYINKYFNLLIPINFSMAKINVKNDNYNFRRSESGKWNDETITMPNSSHMVSYLSFTPTLTLFIKPIFSLFDKLVTTEKKQINKLTISCFAGEDNDR